MERLVSLRVALASILPPRSGTDLATILMILITSSGSFSQYTFTILAGLALLLASYNQTLQSESKHLALFTFGVSRAWLLVGYYLKGVLLFSIGILPYQAYEWTSHYGSPFSPTLLLSIALGGSFYALPCVRELGRARFARLTKR